MGQGGQGCGEELGTQVYSPHSLNPPQPRAPLPSCNGPGAQHFKSLEQRLAQRQHSEIVCPVNSW